MPRRLGGIRRCSAEAALVYLGLFLMAALILLYFYGCWMIMRHDPKEMYAAHADIYKLAHRILTMQIAVVEFFVDSCQRVYDVFRAIFLCVVFAFEYLHRITMLPTYFLPRPTFFRQAVGAPIDWEYENEKRPHRRLAATFRPVFDYLRPKLCEDPTAGGKPPPPCGKAPNAPGSWLSYFISFTYSSSDSDSPSSCSSAEEVLAKQNECAFFVSTAVVAFFACFFFFVCMVFYAHDSVNRDNTVDRVNRGTNTPRNGAAAATDDVAAAAAAATAAAAAATAAATAAAAAAGNDNEATGKAAAAKVGIDAAVGSDATVGAIDPKGLDCNSDEFRGLHEELVRLTKLLEARKRDKDTRIEELSFENRALRQNAIDEREHQTCIVCRVEPRRVVLFPCRHLCLCENCSDHHHFSTCPYCRTRSVKAEKIFV